MFNLQMASVWLPSSGRLYLPPPTPVAKLLNTDDFVQRTDLYYHAGSERLLMVGNPFFPVINGQGTVIVPKVSPMQYRAFRCKLPDPNQFTFPNADIYNPEKQRLVWGVRGIEICRGQPLGIPSTGHPFFNKLRDVENSNQQPAPPGGDDDPRKNIGLDPKQVQMLIIGCTPCVGEHWDKAETCIGDERGNGTTECPPIELVNTIIEDGNMADIGFGNLNNKTLQEDKSETPLDIVQEIVKHPDFLKMGSDPFGNSMWFYARREQLYARHMWNRTGVTGEDVPSNLFFAAKSDLKMGSIAYFNSPSGSLVTTDQQIFNRPYWLQRAQGLNNGIAWNNEVFITCVDTTRGTNFHITMRKNPPTGDVYKASEFRVYNRHVEEYEIAMICQLCIVDLEPEVLAHLHNMDPNIIDSWNLGFIHPPNNLEDKYRFIQSLATRCPDKDAAAEPKDPYEGKTFWNVDLTKSFSTELEQYSLGRKFQFQTGLRGIKRPAPKAVSFKASSSTSRPVKRRRKNA